MKQEEDSLLTCNEQDSSTSEYDAEPTKSKPDMFQTAVNITKLCMGTGTLALPFGAGQGGLLFNVIGFAFIAQWNVYAIDRLVKCLAFVQQHRRSLGKKFMSSSTSTTDVESVVSSSSDKEREKIIADSKRKYVDYDAIGDESQQFILRQEKLQEFEEPATNTFGKVAWYAFGELGLHLTDVFVLIFMIGVIVAYEDVILSFLAKTPLTTGSKGYDSIIMLVFITPIACISNFDLIAKFSAFGIFIIFGVYFSVAAFGISCNGLEGFNLVTTDNFWPTDFSGFSNWFGVAAFGYAIVPFNYNIQESMEDQTQMNTATKIACWTVCATYIAIGDIISIIFLPTIPEFEGDVISALPQTTFPILIRIAMTFVVLSTLPLIIVPAGDLIMKKMDMNESQLNVVGIRLAVCFLGAYTSVVVPNFVSVISFLGCFCASMLSFAYPPLVHLVCHYKYGEGRNVKDDNGGCQLNVYIIDSLLLIIGMTTTIFTSIMTYESLIKQMQ